MAVILAGGEGERLSILSQVRAKPAVPFGGKYRIIDFTLSNCVNSDIDDVVVLTQYNPRSLNDHIGLGRPWDLDRNHGGVKLLQPYIARGRVAEWYRGHGRRGPAQHQRPRARRRPTRSSSSPATTSTRWTTSRSSPPTAATGPTSRSRSAACRSPRRRGWGSSPSTRTTASSSGRRSPSSPRATSPRWASTSSRRRRSGAGCPRTASTSGRNVIPAMLDAGARVFGYRYNGYWQDVGTIQSFWEANMALLDDDPELDLYDKDWVIHTRSEERAPAKVGPTAQVHRSLISHGCVIDGHGRQLGPVARRPGRRRRGRARLDRHVRLGHPLRRRRRPGDPRQGGRRRPGRHRRRRPVRRPAEQAGARPPQHRHHGRRQARGRSRAASGSAATSRSPRTSARPTSPAASSAAASRSTGSGPPASAARRDERGAGRGVGRERRPCAASAPAGHAPRPRQEGRRRELTLGRTLATISARLRGPCHPPTQARLPCARPMSRAGSASSA